MQGDLVEPGSILGPSAWGELGLQEATQNIGAGAQTQTGTQRCGFRADTAFGWRGGALPTWFIL